MLHYTCNFLPVFSPITVGGCNVDFGSQPHRRLRPGFPTAPRIYTSHLSRKYSFGFPYFALNLDLLHFSFGAPSRRLASSASGSPNVRVSRNPSGLLNLREHRIDLKDW
ncbi:hypothetical protein XPA_000167 [Xanthoria parietina]